VAHAFQQQAFDDGISVTEAPVESANTMSHVECYHTPLHAAYLKVRSTCGRDTSSSDVLQLEVEAVNDTVGPEGLYPTILVFGSIPRPARTTRACTQLSRTSALEKACERWNGFTPKRRSLSGFDTVALTVVSEKI
jgi:hypothetical protein